MKLKGQKLLEKKNTSTVTLLQVVSIYFILCKRTYRKETVQHSRHYNNESVVTLIVKKIKKDDGNERRKGGERRDTEYGIKSQTIGCIAV